MKPTKLPCCGSLVYALSPLQLHWRWGCHGPGAGLLRCTWSTVRLCRWNKSTQEDAGGWRSPSPPVQSEAPPVSVPWMIFSHGVSEDACSTVTPRTSGRSSQPVTVHLYSGHRKSLPSQAQSQVACPAALQWHGNLQQCSRVWSFFAETPHPETPHGTLGIVEMFCHYYQSFLQSCRCRFDSSCAHRGEQPDQSRAEGRWGSSAPRLADPLALTKTWWKVMELCCSSWLFLFSCHLSCQNLLYFLLYLHFSS